VIYLSRYFGKGKINNLPEQNAMTQVSSLYVTDPALGATGLPQNILLRTGRQRQAFEQGCNRGATLKALQDYALAAIGLFLALPIFLVIALAIKLDSRGPVLFRQRRHGRDHRIITVLKFRTMNVCEDGDKVTQARRGDTRITRIGWLLRRSSLDELPQLINVLRGEMSIVGPRPHALAHNAYYGSLIENYGERHQVKPGITGWAQVHGFRGETSSLELMASRVRYDLEYVENRSVWLDLKIIVMTPLFALFSNAR